MMMIVAMFVAAECSSSEYLLLIEGPQLTIDLTPHRIHHHDDHDHVVDRHELL